VLFDHDSSKIKAGNEAIFANALDVLKQNPALTIEIQGHTDSDGTEEYNQKLSERRANAVKQKLVDNGVNPARLTTKGFGELNPAASNATEEGRAYNRRVQHKRTDM
jgi:OOP family OmpA-OmpF porin